MRTTRITITAPYGRLHAEEQASNFLRRYYGYGVTVTGIRLEEATDMGDGARYTYTIEYHMLDKED